MAKIQLGTKLFSAKLPSKLYYIVCACVDISPENGGEGPNNEQKSSLVWQTVLCDAEIK